MRIGLDKRLGANESTSSRRHKDVAGSSQESSLASGRFNLHQLHLLFDTHQQQQGELVDTVAERIQCLGAYIGIGHDVADRLIPQAQ
jgi:hypothetical protein